MRLYIKDKETGQKTYIQRVAKDRQQLVSLVGSERLKIKNKVYAVSSVKAEVGQKTAQAVTIGGVVGIIGGVPGVLIGGLIGGLLGKNSENEDRAKVDVFNRSKYVK